jgi:hypothetical protein
MGSAKHNPSPPSPFEVMKPVEEGMFFMIHFLSNSKP